jgi:hypothetical protein
MHSIVQVAGSMGSTGQGLDASVMHGDGLLYLSDNSNAEIHGGPPHP